MSDRILLGGVDITDAITPKEQVPAGVSLDDIDEIRRGYSFSTSKVEDRLKSLLASQRIIYTYPKIDLGFLTTSSYANYFPLKREVQVPKFPVFRFIKGNDFRITCSQASRRWGLFGNPFSKMQFNSGDHQYNRVLKAYLLQSIGFKDINLDNCESSLPCDERMFELSASMWENYGIGISLECIFPKTSRQMATNAEVLFNSNELYIAAEAKPQDWYGGFIPEKAMIFGERNNEFYLVDIFSPIKLNDKIPQGKIDKFLKAQA